MPPTATPHLVLSRIHAFPSLVLQMGLCLSIQSRNIYKAEGTPSSVNADCLWDDPCPRIAHSLQRHSNRYSNAAWKYQKCFLLRNQLFLKLYKTQGQSPKPYWLCLSFLHCFILGLSTFLSRLPIFLLLTSFTVSWVLFSSSPFSLFGSRLCVSVGECSGTSS